MAKILVNRIRPMLGKLIGPIQRGFVRHQSINDNILLTHEIINKFKSKVGKKSWVTLRLDMEKAYDRVKWNFMFQALK